MVSAAINTPAPLASPRSPDLYFTYQPATQPLGNDNNNAGYTWGAEFNMRQRRSTLEDTAQTNRLYEVELHSLKSDAQQRYYLGKSLSLRSYENELSDSLHASLEWWDTQWHDNISLHSGATIAAQEGALTGDWGWSARINAALDIKTSWNRRWFNRLTFDSWARVLDSDDITGEYATSVYSQYKLDHRYGLNISDHLRLKVHHDTELWGKIAINSNPLFDEFSIDNLVTQLGARAFYKGLAADIKWQYRRFFVDRDRRRLLKDYRIGVGLDWFAWQQNSHFRIRLGYDRDLSNDENYWSVRFIFNDDSGRGVRDYMPQSLSFSGLRHQQFMLEEHEQ
jgi:hypothetical protein